MRNTITSVLDSLLFSNLFIACCAMGQGALTYILLKAPVNVTVIALLGFSTFFLYNFSLILSKPVGNKPSPFKRANWFFKQYRIVVALSIVAFLAIFPLALQLSTQSFFLLAGISLLALSYNAPILKIGANRYGFRNIPGTKLFIIASVWAFSCVWLPITELKSQNFYITGVDTFLLIFKRFLFVMAITLPFDIRDLYQDRQFHLKTIPVLIGKNNSLILCQFLLLTYIVLLFVFTETIDNNMLTLTIITLLTGLFILNTKINKNEYYYFLLLDGTLLLQFAAVWTADKLS